MVLWILPLRLGLRGFDELRCEIEGLVGDTAVWRFRALEQLHALAEAEEGRDARAGGEGGPTLEEVWEGDVDESAEWLAEARAFRSEADRLEGAAEEAERRRAELRAGHADFREQVELRRSARGLGGAEAELEDAKVRLRRACAHADAKGAEMESLHLRCVEVDNHRAFLQRRLRELQRQI